MLVAHLAIPFERLLDDSFEFWWDLRIQSFRCRWSSMQQRIKYRSRCTPLEGQCAGCHLVEHNSEGKQVGSRIECFAQHLLGRHVRYHAQGRSGASEMAFVV